MKINDENGSKMSKDNFYTVKQNETIKNETITISDNPSLSPGNNCIHSNKKTTPKNMNPKSANVNLWRRPVVGGHQSNNSNGSNMPSQQIYSSSQNGGGGENQKIKNQKNTKNKNCNNSNNTNQKNYIGNDIVSNPNISTINNDENKKEDTTIDVNYKNASSILNYMDTPKNRKGAKIQSGYTYSNNLFPATSSKMLKNNFNPFDPINENEEQRKSYERERDNIHINYLTNYNTNINITSNENIQSEILSSILNFKSLMKPNESQGQIDKLMKNEDNINKLNLLNSKLNLYGGGFAKSNIGPGSIKLNESKSLLNENNIIKRDTFIEPSMSKQFSNKYIENKYNKININVINAEMLGDDIAKPRQIKKEEIVIQNQIEGNKEKIIKEINDHSDIRMKRYEILLDFISSNLKEINQIMNTSNINQNLNTPIEASRELNRIDEVNSNKLSSLHSKINLNSKTNINFGEVNESDMQEKINVIKKDESNIHSTLNLNELLLTHINKNFYEPSPSFLISSINSEFYQNLLEESYMNGNQMLNFNISHDMGSSRTQAEQMRKLEWMMGNESDKAPLHFIGRHLNNPSGSSYSQFTLSHRINPHYENRINANNGDDGEMCYNEGEENLTDSDLDKTKEQIQVVDSRKLNYNQVAKDIERVKFFSANINKNMDSNLKNDFKENKTSKSPDEKQSKCIIY